MKVVYVGINNFMHKHPFIKSSVQFTSGFCPYMVAIFYFLFLLKIYLEWNSHLYSFIVQPVLATVITGILKMLINRQRPMEAYNIKPLDDKKRTGHSFPSIQVACSLSIALTVLHYGPNMGLLLFVLSCIITASRFLNGSHYLTDILASVLIAAILNLIRF